MKEQFKNLGKALARFALGVAAVWLNAYVVTVLWAWFAVAVFGVPSLSIAAVLGLHLLYTMFVINHRGETKFVEDGFSADIASIVVSVLALGVGGVIHMGM